MFTSHSHGYPYVNHSSSPQVWRSKHKQPERQLPARKFRNKITGDQTASLLKMQQALHHPLSVCVAVMPATFHHGVCWIPIRLWEAGGWEAVRGDGWFPARLSSDAPGSHTLTQSSLRLPSQASHASGKLECVAWRWPTSLWICSFQVIPCGWRYRIITKFLCLKKITELYLKRSQNSSLKKRLARSEGPPPQPNSSLLCGFYLSVSTVRPPFWAFPVTYFSIHSLSHADGPNLLQMPPENKSWF